MNMKKILFLASMALTSVVYSQTASNQASFAHTTEKRDTLYLLKNDTMATVTFGVWKSDKSWNGTNPTILFVNDKQMRELKENYVLVRREKSVTKLNN